ncbi:hypothetical protein [Paenibacillus algicola]|nr:hypothetical protein [Paenibacillus algicola]
MASQNNPYIQVIGNFLIQYVQANPESAVGILGEGKSIAKSLDAMKQEGQKKQSNGMAMITGQDILKYFGIDGPPMESVYGRTDIKPVPDSSRFDAKLDDFL